MKVLLLVDIQNDFCPGGALAVTEGDAVIPVANALMRSHTFDLVIATQDWHPAKHESFAENHENAKLFDVGRVGGCQQHLWPRHCVQGSRGAELHPALDTRFINHVVRKGEDVSIDSYSAFFDNRRERETRLRQLLEEAARSRGEALRDISLNVCGLATDFCVAATLRDARELGLQSTLIVDGCRAVNIRPDDEVKTLRALAQEGVELVHSRDLLINHSIHLQSKSQALKHPGLQL